MIVFNKEFPFRETQPRDNFGQADDSEWSFILTPEYINCRQEKIIYLRKPYEMNFTELWFKIT
jgi:hypothetical protein